ncbi:DUF928 domain-containing protein [Pantanalinema sp. GBBB05]|uniref:DUF928 domain-containing protein n=1 Tax=Pantanalinema sp. GBBB05 TaxID=2604139 RepID=UPI001DFE61CB|nr:DUF928 domain-containing protein [Pantanalinema sp. GBBB05]
MKRQFQKISLKRAIATAIVSVLTIPTWVICILISPTEATLVAQVNAIGFKLPPPPPDRDAPGRRGGGAGRGCGAGNQSITALMPEYQQALERGTITKVWGTTTTERPTFWFDIPYENGAIAAMEFVLQDNSSPAREIYRSAIVPPMAPGVISIRLPASVPPLEGGKLYQWFFKVRLQCGSDLTAAKPQIQKADLNGWVQRVSPSPTLTHQLQQATPQQQAALYAQNGIWFDALTTLAEQRLTHPQEAHLIADWQTLLRSIGLEPLTTKSLIACCRSQP